MPVRPVTFGFVAVALLTTALATGCSGGGTSEAKGEKSPSPNAEEVAYYRCLERNGVVLEERDDNQLRVDKDKNGAAVQSAAQEKCAGLRSHDTSAPAASAPAAFVAKAEKFSACVRENGFPEYPDPDPKTGEVELADDEEATYKSTRFLAAADKCSADAGSDIVGG